MVFILIEELLTIDTFEIIISLIKGGDQEFWNETKNYDILIQVAEINLFSDVEDFHSENIFG